MAKKKRLENQSEGFKCKDCKNCHSPYSKNHVGENILAKCSESKHSTLLSFEQCEKFKLKKI